MARINITRGAWATSFALETVPSDKILYVHLKVQDAIYLPQRKNNCLIELTWILFTQVCLWQVWLKLTQLVLHNKVFKSGMYFLLTKLTLLHKRIFCTKFGWKRPSCPAEDDFKKEMNVFHFLGFISPLNRTCLTRPFGLTLESPLPQFGLKWSSGSREEKM